MWICKNIWCFLYIIYNNTINWAITRYGFPNRSAFVKLAQVDLDSCESIFLSLFMRKHFSLWINFFKFVHEKAFFVKRVSEEDWRVKWVQVGTSISLLHTEFNLSWNLWFNYVLANNSDLAGSLVTNSIFFIF